MASAKPDGIQFEVHLTGDVTRKTWDGTFKAKPTLSFRDRFMVDRTRRELVGFDGVTSDPEVAATAVIIAELGVRITESPEWWRESKGGLDLADPNVLQKVFEAAKKIEFDHFERLEAEGKAAQEKLKELK